jgi:hypothetical protein
MIRAHSERIQIFTYDFEQMVTAYRKSMLLYREGCCEWTKSGSEGDFLWK